MIMNVPGVEDMVTRINEELPPEIRLWGYVGLILPCYLMISMTTS